MHQLLLIALLSVAACLSSAARADDTNCPYHKLTWDDFKGDPPPAGSDESAHVFVGAKYGAFKMKTKQNADGSFSATSADVPTYSFIDKTQSGVQAGAKTDALLQHEQYHFDIAEYWAKELAKALNGITGTGATAAAAQADCQAKVDAKYQEMDKKCRELQEQYDSETEHGSNAEKQAEWCKKLGEMLLAYVPGAHHGDGVAMCSYNPGTDQLLISNVHLNSSWIDGHTVNDPFMQNGFISFPPLYYQGHHMGPNYPLLMADEMAAQATIHAGNGQPAISGTLRLCMGSGNRFTGWFAEANFNDAVNAASPLLSRLVDLYDNGSAYLSIAILTPVPLEQASAFWTQPCNLQAIVKVGLVYEPHRKAVPIGR